MLYSIYDSLFDDSAYLLFVYIFSSSNGCDNTENMPVKGIKTKQWRCESCTLLNPLQVAQCIACTAWKPKTPRIVEEDVPESHDDEDTGNSNPTTPTENGVSLDNAAAENNNKEDATRVDVEYAQWKCRRCTLLNPLTASRCQVCETPKKDNVPTTFNGDDSRPSSSTSRPSPSASPSPSSSSSSPSSFSKDNWTCQHCNQRNNSASSQKCKKCKKPKATPSNNHHNHIVLWSLVLEYVFMPRPPILIL